MLPLYQEAPDAIPVYIGAQHGDVKISRLRRFFREGKRTLLACFNPHSYAVALKDNVFARALKDADWLVLDGTGIVLAIKRFSRSSAEI